MVLLASRHRICIVDMSYNKHFVWNALPEERDAGCRQSVGAAWSSSSLTYFLGPKESQMALHSAPREATPRFSATVSCARAFH
eukprot:3532296-Prymnesium_polylepis.1